MAVLGRSRSGPPPDQILDPPLLGMVSAVDEAIGAIHNALEETGMLDNTLLVFSSDVSSSSSITK